MTVPIAMKRITVHFYILSGEVNSCLLPLSEKYILLLRSNMLGKRWYYYFAVCEAINVNSTFSNDCP